MVFQQFLDYFPAVYIKRQDFFSFRECNSKISSEQEMTRISTCVKNVYNHRTEEKFCDIWDEVVTQIDAH